MAIENRARETRKRWRDAARAFYVVDVRADMTIFAAARLRSRARAMIGSPATTATRSRPHWFHRDLRRVCGGTMIAVRRSGRIG
jgi:hypothetical protein